MSAALLHYLFSVVYFVPFMLDITTHLSVVGQKMCTNRHIFFFFFLFIVIVTKTSF